MQNKHDVMKPKQPNIQDTPKKRDEKNCKAEKHGEITLFGLKFRSVYTLVTRSNICVF